MITYKVKTFQITDSDVEINAWLDKMQSDDFKVVRTDLSKERYMIMYKITEKGHNWK